jgi:hypothetical protein
MPIQYHAGMRFRVVPTHLRGIPRPKREIARADGVVGDLITSNRSDELLSRTTLVATLIDPKGGAKAAELLPPLYDAALVLIAPSGMMFRGASGSTWTMRRLLRWCRGGGCGWCKHVTEPACTILIIATRSPTRSTNRR